MKRFCYSAMIAVLLAGCATVSKVASDNPVKTVGANSSNYNAENQTGIVPTNQSPAFNRGNAENFNSASRPRLQDSTVSRESLDRLTSKRNSGATAEPLPATAATPNPAPDKSEIYTTMNGAGVPIETRIFKANRKLAKVERTFEDAINPVTKIYLKDGRILTAAKDAVAKPESASGDDFLRAVGVKP